MENKITITYNGKEYIFYIKIHHRYWGITCNEACNHSKRHGVLQRYISKESLKYLIERVNNYK